MPSWLYQVDQGATTVWERWDAIRPDGTIHDGIMHMPDGDGHMLSFNHYAYGAVIDWVYRTLAGVAPDVDRPGYRHIVISPAPVRGVDHVAADVRTAFGPVSVSWTVAADDTFTATYRLPFGVTATISAPTTEQSVVTGSTTLGPGEHTLVVTRARVVDPAAASH
jgi:alpha-L-rhamnosidase